MILIYLFIYLLICFDNKKYESIKYINENMTFRQNHEEMFTTFYEGTNYTCFDTSKSVTSSVILLNFFIYLFICFDNKKYE